MKKVFKKSKSFLIISIFLSFITLISCESTPFDENKAFGDIADITESVFTAVNSAAGAMERFSPEQEYFLGLAVANSVCQVYQPLEFDERADYLNKICRTLTINSGKPHSYKGYHVILVHSDDINAISTPGGHIFVTDALLKMCTSEDEIAAVIAHELAHIQLKHSIITIRTKRGTKALLNATDAVFNANLFQDSELKSIASDFSNLSYSLTDTIFHSGFSNIMEYDADREALNLLYEAGYNPASIKDLLNHLQEEKVKKARRKGKKSFSVNATHPSPKNRMKMAENILKLYKGNYMEETRVARFEANRLLF